MRETNKVMIKKGSLIIRSAEIKDAEILTNWWNDGRVMAHAGFPNGLGQTIEETVQQIEGNEVRLSQRCIIECEDVRIGEMGFGIGKQLAEIGIKVCDESYQNQGYGTKLIQMIIDFLFNDERINEKIYIEKIILDTNLNNERAQRVYEKIGFEKVSTNMNAWEDQLGEWQHSVDYEMTRENYEINGTVNE